MSRDKELWGMALWVEKHHGEDGRVFLGEQVGRLKRTGDQFGAATWNAVAARYEALQQTHVPIHGQIETQLN